MVATAEKATTRELVAWKSGVDPDERARLPRMIEDFRDESGEMVNYKSAPDLTGIATALIEAFPNYFGHLRQFAILWLWAQTLGGSRGVLRWWQAIIPKKVLAWLLGRDERPDFAAAQAILIVSLAACKEANLTYWSWEALIYAILTCLEDNDDGGVRVVPFDEEKEAAVAARYGDWSPRLKRLVDALTNGHDYQLRLDAAAAERQAQAVQAAKDAVKAELREAMSAVLK